MGEITELNQASGIWPNEFIKMNKFAIGGAHQSAKLISSSRGLPSGLGDVQGIKVLISCEMSSGSTFSQEGRVDYFF